MTEIRLGAESIRRAASDDRLGMEREYCERRLRNFVHRAWPILEPRTVFSRGALWYVDAICEHLEALFYAQIRNLLINVPGRVGKSLTSCVFFPSWAWTKRPEFRSIFSSYAAYLSRRDSRKTRTVIRSNWYQSMWGDRFTILDDQDQVNHFTNNVAGFRVATSVGGVGTGEGGHLIAVDDPHNVKQAESDLQREEAITWWDETMGDRLDDPKTGGRLVVAHRTHAHDLSQHCLDKGDYVHLMLPMEYEPSRRCITPVKPYEVRKGTQQPSPSGLYPWDPRTKEGELMDPDRFGKPEVAQLKVRLGSYAWPARLQQRPSLREGGMVKLHWFQRYATPKDKYDAIVQSWDTANKKGVGNAYSVCGTFGRIENGWHLLHVHRERLNSPDLKRVVISLTETRWGKPSSLLIEDKASGTGLIQHLQEETDLPVIPIEPDADKITRMDNETPALEAGRIWLPEIADWLPDFESEMRDYPGSTYMDQGDMLSQFLRWVRLHYAGGADDWELI